MTRIVIDTNILVSAILTTKGNPAKILKHVLEGKLNLIISPAILKETQQVLRYPRLVKLMKKNKITMKEVYDFLDKMSKVAVITPGQLDIDAIPDDPADNKILACAMEGEADYIISGDHHLTDLKIFQGIKIMNPSTFLKIINIRR
jgi:putative PIN family toxin of toxin-antitoxin system